jgi:gliding motility-associated-like protein
MKFIYSVFLILGLHTMHFGQSPNDECITSILIQDPTSYCSENGAFTLNGASLSDQVSPFCFPQGSGDVWFRFVAVAEVLNVRIIGQNGILPGGTLRNPQVAIYEGNCGNLLERGCLSDAFNNNIVELVLTDLFPSRTYYIRVDSRIGNTGTFQVCVNNFNAVPEPSSDCITGVLLCDKSSFSVPSLIGSGLDRNEVAGTCIQEEFSSAWYKWTCETAGSLTFTLTPNGPSDDLDFALYELPNGVEDCSNKRILRCMASGENLGQPISEWIRCYGPTGLRVGSNDVVETPGCQPGDDNFLAPLNMEAGKSYALIVNNFSNTGNGFSIDFGGTGVFVGPKADFEIVTDKEEICRWEVIELLDKSESVFGGDIISWNWRFGIGGDPVSKSEQGPHQVIYNSPGYKTITLRISNEKGCIVTKTENILVECCDYPVFINAGEEGRVSLGDSIQLNVDVDLPGNSYTYNWRDPALLNCFNCKDPIALVGKQTTFYVEVEDEQGCIAVDSVTIFVDIVRPVYIPTAFTPNRDGINDRFNIYVGNAVTNINVFRIFDRWGNMVYQGFDLEPNNELLGWDGIFRQKDAPEGVYVYYAEVAFLDEEVLSYSGDVTLIR